MLTGLPVARGQWKVMIQMDGVLEILRQELDRAMGYCGQNSVRELEPDLVSIPSDWGPGRNSSE